MAKRWSDFQLRKAVRESVSIRQVICKLGLIPAGGNYIQVKESIDSLRLSTKHFLGRSANKGRNFSRAPLRPLEDILRIGTVFGSHKLKLRLFKMGLKSRKCEECGWAKQSSDGRVPVELDHVNGDRYDNRIENLRILCPNCHSLKPTHRGRNKGVSRGGEIGKHATLKTL